MLTAVLLAALLGQADYALAPSPQVNDYAFAPLPSEHLTAIRPAKKRTEPTPAKCPGGVCVSESRQVAKTKSVLIESTQQTIRRTVWRGRSFLRRTFRR